MGREDMQIQVTIVPPKAPQIEVDFLLDPHGKIRLQDFPVYHCQYTSPITLGNNGLPQGWIDTYGALHLYCCANPAADQVHVYIERILANITPVNRLLHPLPNTDSLHSDRLLQSIPSPLQTNLSRDSPVTLTLRIIRHILTTSPLRVHRSWVRPKGMSVLQVYHSHALELLYHRPWHPPDVSFSNRAKSSLTTCINPSVACQSYPAFPLYLLVSENCSLCWILLIQKVVNNPTTTRSPRSMRRPISHDCTLADLVVDLARAQSLHLAIFQSFEERRDEPKSKRPQQIQSPGKKSEMETREERR
jgi:hypothetical protein